jgi:hypothetical protein
MVGTMKSRRFTIGMHSNVKKRKRREMEKGESGFCMGDPSESRRFIAKLCTEGFGTPIICTCGQCQKERTVLWCDSPTSSSGASPSSCTSQEGALGRSWPTMGSRFRGMPVLALLTGTSNYSWATD